jgi:hypothetical protein
MFQRDLRKPGRQHLQWNMFSAGYQATFNFPIGTHIDEND